LNEIAAYFLYLRLAVFSGGLHSFFVESHSMLIPRNVFSLHTLTNAEPCRYQLGGVRFERTDDGPVAVATDGYAMMSLTWPEPAGYPELVGIDAAPIADFSCNVSAETCRQAERIKLDAKKLRLKPVLDHVVMDESQTESLNLMATDEVTTQRLSPDPLENRFPNWRSSVSPTLNAKVKVNARRLIALLEVAAKHSGDFVELGLGDHDTLVVTGEQQGKKSYGVVYAEAIAL
jgi:hypothetical protein